MKAKAAIRVVAFTVLTLAIFVLAAAAQQVPNIQGRWEFVIDTGDSQSQQLNVMGQSTLSTYLIQSGSNIGNDVPDTYTTFAADEYVYANTVITGTVTRQGNVTLTATTTNPDKTSFKYVFSGALDEEDGAITLEGTYTSTAWSSNGHGKFTATFFPDFSNVTYAGSFNGPDVGDGPVDVPASFTINTLPDHTVSISNLKLGQPLAACFQPPFHVQNDPNFPLSHSAADGLALEVYLVDSVGGELWLNGYAVQKDGFSPAALNELYDPTTPLPKNLSQTGSNDEYVIWYGITTNNSCSGLGGGDSPFKVKSEKREKKIERRIRRGDQRDRESR
jgi:hypothetical protein